MPNLIRIGGCFGAANIYADLFDDTIEIPVRGSSVHDLHQIKEGDVVMLGGGEDISPSIYRTPRAWATSARDVPSVRDQLETSAFNQARKVGAAVYGICRGAQLVCALSGGVLVQHVTGHQQNHAIITKDGEEYITSSVHHQMMWPFDRVPMDQFELIGWSKETRSRGYVFTDEDVRDKLSVEPEIIYFKESKSLGIQGHPEFMNINAPFVTYSRKLVRQYLLNEKE